MEANVPGPAPVPPRADPTEGETARAGWVPADPGPLGLAAFAMTTFVLSMYNAHLVNSSGVPVVFSLALFYGGLAQLLAGMWEFRTGNTFGAVAFSSFGAFWLSFWALNVFYAKDLSLLHAHKDVGLYLYAWGIFTAYMWVASFRTTAAVNLVFFLLTATFFLLAIGATGLHTNVTKWGGYVGIATAIAAWYASFAAVTNSTFGRVVLPVIPLNVKRCGAPGAAASLGSAAAPGCQGADTSSDPFRAPADSR